MGIENTTAWQEYIDAATLRGWPFGMRVQLHEKPQRVIAQDEDERYPSGYVEAEQPDRAEGRRAYDIESQGVADEGERIIRIVDEMEAEDRA
jgi:hypothetical protein